ncbi:hypothetical protein CLV88_104124 [Shimia abyssi]|uniref:Uncharacterized protein n=1 Tax=Shimia abyssi TaxID=1662395 RepID=A0A2P8FEE8_9RHOB|nr:hypothetical protein CLV88_104124 [Shimia abyssi]
MIFEVGGRFSARLVGLASLGRLFERWLDQLCGQSAISLQTHIPCCICEGSKSREKCSNPQHCKRLAEMGGKAIVPETCIPTLLG